MVWINVIRNNWINLIVIERKRRALLSKLFN